MNEGLQHLDLFAGLGAWTIACSQLGIKTVAFCENDGRCQSFLGRAWPGIPIIGDVRTLDGTRFRGIDLLSAGTPCQPASRAGDQRGSDDDRWLWGEVVRIIREARPRVVVCENPPGIDDVGLDGILAELEASGYEIAPIFDIPACAVNSPQLRHRYYIVAYATEQRREGADAKPGANGCGAEHSESDMANSKEGGQRQRSADGGGQPEGVGTNGHRERPSDNGISDMANTDTRRSHLGEGEPEREPEGRDVDRGIGPGNLADTQGIGEWAGFCHPGSGKERGILSADHGFWDNYVWLPCADGKVRRAPMCPVCMANGVSSELSEELGQTHAEGCENLVQAHRSLIGALGNSQVPQVAYIIVKAAVENLL